MDPKLYSQIAEEAGVRYATVLAALQGVLLSRQDQSFSAAAMNSIRYEAQRVIDAFARSEVVMIREALRSTAQNAQEQVLGDLNVISGVSLTPMQKSFLEQSQGHLEIEVGSQLQRDVESLIRSFRESAIEKELNGKPTKARVTFAYRDRAGRQIASQRFIRVAWRQSLVALGAEFYLMEAVARGAKEVSVNHPDPKNKWFGVRIDLGDGEGESFTAIRDEVFHPMTNASLTASL